MSAASRTMSTLLRLLPWIAVAISCWPIATGGFPRGHDWPFELTRVAEYQAALLAGQLPPYWGENLYAGYGSPVFLFYAPLFSAGSALLAWAAGSVAQGASLFLVVLSALSVWTAGGLFRAALGEAPNDQELLESATRVGVYVFVLSPYLIGDKLLRNANAEFAGLCLIPLVIHGVLCLASQPRRGFVLLSAGLALSILAHNLTALVALGLALIAALFVHLPPRDARVFPRLGAAIAFGLLLAGFFWIPATSLTSLVSTEELLRGKFDFHNGWPPLASVFGYQHFYAAGLLAPAILALAALVALRATAAAKLPGAAESPVVRRDRRTRMLVAAVAGSLGFLFLLTPFSELVWETVPLLPFFQFPWRMMGPLALLTALAAALAYFALLSGRDGRQLLLAELATFALCALNALPLLGQYRELEPQARSERWLTPESVRNSTRSVTVGHEYLPRGAARDVWMRARPKRGAVVSATPDVAIVVREDTGSRIGLDVRAAAPARLRLARWHFPGWRLTLDGEPAALERNPYGSIDVAVPAGDTRVDLVCRAPPVRDWSLAASGLTLAVWLFVLLRAPRWLGFPASTRPEG